MNLDNIKGETRTLKTYSLSLKEQYKDAIHYLSNIYNIINRHDSNLARDISRIIDKFYEMIKILDNEYLFSLEDIERYISATNRNIDELTINFTKVASILEECISSSK